MSSGNPEKRIELYAEQQELLTRETVGKFIQTILKKKHLH